jgi:transposase-like protein
MACPDCPYCKEELIEEWGLQNDNECLVGYKCPLCEKSFDIDGDERG